MIKNVVLILLIFIFCINQQSVLAQSNDDFESTRTKIGVVYKANLKTTFQLNFRFDTKENFVTFRRSNFTISGKRKINKWLDVGARYRFYSNYTTDMHRFNIFTDFNKKYKGLAFSFRSMAQHDMAYFDKEYLQNYQAEYIWRNRLSIDKSINKRWNVGIFSEHFTNFSQAKTSPYRWRNAIHVDYQLKKHNLSLGYFIQNTFNVSKPKTNGVVTLDYIYDISSLLQSKKVKKEFKKAKKKKKKKKQQNLQLKDENKTN